MKENSQPLESPDSGGKIVEATETKAECLSEQDLKEIESALVSIHEQTRPGHVSEAEASRRARQSQRDKELSCRSKYQDYKVAATMVHRNGKSYLGGQVSPPVIKLLCCNGVRDPKKTCDFPAYDESKLQVIEFRICQVRVVTKGVFGTFRFCIFDGNLDQNEIFMAGESGDYGYWAESHVVIAGDDSKIVSFKPLTFGLGSENGWTVAVYSLDNDVGTWIADFLLSYKIYDK